jgi:uncharacterized membrane protein YozB (DUF420 family)
MTVALLFYLAGFYYRRRDLRIHRILMSLGIFSTVAAAVALLVAVRLIHDGDRVAAGFVSAVDEWIVVAHRVVASVTFVLMFVMLGTGIGRRRAIHVATARWFLPLYVIVYISGLLIFKN